MARTNNPSAATRKAWLTRKQNADRSGASASVAARAFGMAEANPVARAVAREKQAELEAHQSSEKDERAVIIDITTGRVLVDARGRDFPAEPWDRAEWENIGWESGSHGVDTVAAMVAAGTWNDRMDAGDKSILSMHTHPDNAAFSDGDWAVFASSSEGEMRVIASDDIYRLRKTAQWDQIPWIKRTPRALKERYNAILDEATAFGSGWNVGPDPVKAAFTATNRRMAEEFGVEFTVSPR